MSMPTPPSAKPQARAAAMDAAGLLADPRGLIEQSRQAAAAVNAGLTLMYWRIGARIRHEVLGGERARYGAEIVVTLSRQLAAEYGRGFEEKNLRRMVRFPQDPKGEPTSVLLERIRAARTAQAVSSRRRSRKAKETA
jgi:hypothetical protein